MCASTVRTFMKMQLPTVRSANRSARTNPAWDRESECPPAEKNTELIENLALDILDAVLCVLYPEPQLELDRGLAEGHDQRVRCRYSQDALRVVRGLAHQRERLVEIGVVRHTHRYFQPHTITLVRPVAT